MKSFFRKWSPFNIWCWCLERPTLVLLCSSDGWMDGILPPLPPPTLCLQVTHGTMMNSKNSTGSALVLFCVTSTAQTSNPQTNQLRHSQGQHILKSSWRQAVQTELKSHEKLRLIHVLIGHSGSIYKKWTLGSMKELGIKSTHAYIGTINQI